MSNILENLNAMISQDTETLSVLPKNSKRNTEEYLKKIAEVRNKYIKLRKQASVEIKERYRIILRKQVKPDVVQLEKEIKSYQNLILLNEDITSYEKMGLDEISYNLKHFYKNDLNLINKQILKCIKAFEKCNVKLSSKDFNYNQYTLKYMTVFFEEMNNDINSSEKIKKAFEEIYWKCSDIMKHINLNIMYVYYKNQKNIEKYFKNEKSKLADIYTAKPQDIIEKYMSLKETYFREYNKDESVLLNKFVYDRMDINRYSDAEIKSEFSKITKNDIDKMSKQELESLNDNIYKLANTLYEYKKYLEYSSIIEDMKKRNEKASKTEYSLEKELKAISSEESKLMKLNAKIEKATSGKPGIVGKGSKIAELFEKNNRFVANLEELYDKFEESLINSKIKKMFADNATIYELLSYASFHFLYFCKCVTKGKTEEELQEINKKAEIQKLQEFLSNPQFNVLIKNLGINDDKKIEQIIIDRYFLFNIEIQEESLEGDNLNELIETVNKIVLYNNIKKSQISVQDIKFMCDLKRITER